MQSRNFIDYYQILGVDLSSSQQQIEEACVILGGKYRIGYEAGDLVATRYFRQVEQAYETLSNAASRREYDIAYSNYMSSENFSQIKIYEDGASNRQEGVLTMAAAIIFAAIFIVMADSPVNTTEHTLIDALRFASLNFLFKSDAGGSLSWEDSHWVSLPLPILLLICLIIFIYGLLVLMNILFRPSEVFRRFRALFL